MNTESQQHEEFEWREGLSAMGSSPEPPVWLEQRVVDLLRARKLLDPRRGAGVRRTWLVGVAAACTICFLAGLFFARIQLHSPSASAQPKFVLLLLSGTGAPSQGSKEDAALVHEYSEWAVKQRAAGRLLEGEKLDDTSVELAGPDGLQVRKQDNRLGGYFVIKAPDFDAALAIARTCPHLQHGGSIVIRPIDPTPSTR